MQLLDVKNGRGNAERNSGASVEEYKTALYRCGMLTKETVEKVALLARLKLNANEIAGISEQLSAVLANFEQIASVDTHGVAPLITPTDMAQHLRVDVSATAESEKMLANAPEKSGRLFKVPPVV